MATIGERLRRFRKLSGKTQPEIGELLGVPQATISKWEKGVQQPSSRHAAQIAAILGEDIGVVMGFGESPQAQVAAPGAAEVPSMDSEEAPHGREGSGHEPGGVHSAPYRHPAFGALKGLITIKPGVDLTEPAFEDWTELYGKGR